MARNESRQAGALPRAFENVSGENPDDAFREIDELLEGWDNRLTINNLAFAKRYIDGELGVGVHFRIWDQTFTLYEEYVSVFQRKLPVGGVDGQFHGRPREIGSWKRCNAPREIDDNVAVASGDGNQQFVLIDDVNLVEAPEGVVRSTVWLTALHKEFGSGGCPVESGRNVAPHVSGCRTYWELGVLGWRPAVIENQGVSEEVQRRSQIVNAIADETSPFRWDAFLHSKAIDFVLRLRIDLRDDVIRLSCVESPDLAVEVVKVFFGPVDLDASAEKRTRVHVEAPQFN